MERGTRGQGFSGIRGVALGGVPGDAPDSASVLGNVSPVGFTFIFVSKASGNALCLRSAERNL